MSALFFSMLSVRSGCKINLFLNVLARRSDGFHELETVMQPLGLYDEIGIRRTDTKGVELKCSHPAVPLGPDNLICRAARLFQSATGREEDGLEIELQKHLPVAAGIGAGSGNAAATLLGLRRLYDERVSEERLWAMAAELGSDVPFFLSPCTTVARGRGEQVQRLPSVAMFRDAYAILVNPGFGVSTPWAYQNLSLNEPGSQASTSLEVFLEILQTGHWKRLTQSVFNSLEEPVLQKYPVLGVIRDVLIEAGADCARMSGSGATVFGLVQSREQGKQVLSRFHDCYGEQCWSQLVALSGTEEC